MSSKKIYAWDLKGNPATLKDGTPAFEHASTTAASRTLDVPATLINTNLGGLSKRAREYVFSREPKFPGYSPSKRGSRPILCFNIEDNGEDAKPISTYDNVMLAQKGSGVPYQKIYQQCIYGSKDPKLPYYFKYGEKPKAEEGAPSRIAKRKVYQSDREGNFIRSFDSISEAAFAMGLTRQAVQAAASGRQPTAGDFVWSYTPPPVAE
jgi:hypothetical protein